MCACDVFSDFVLSCYCDCCCIICLALFQLAFFGISLCVPVLCYCYLRLLGIVIFVTRFARFCFGSAFRLFVCVCLYCFALLLLLSVFYRRLIYLVLFQLCLLLVSPCVLALMSCYCCFPLVVIVAT